ncbi:MAG: FkbM family methyltransferase [Alphaproteobacteria bacterium]|nr:FkbM family methyltransferase [Alphaproteobacteria bacterium]
MLKKNTDFIKYLIIGGWNTIFGLGLYYLFLYFTQKINPYFYFGSSLISNEISIIQSFLAYKFLFFKTKGHYVSEYLKIRALYGVSTLFSLPVLGFVTELSKRFLNDESTYLAPYIGGAITTIITVLFSFFGQKKFVFNTKKIFNKHHTYIFSTGRLAEYLFNLFQKKEIKIDGFIDNDIKKTLSSLHNLPIYSPSRILDKKSNIIIGSINYMGDIKKQLLNQSFKKIYDLGTLISIYPELQKYNQAFDGLFSDYKINKKHYEKLFNLLNDDLSIKTFEAVLNYRKTKNILVYDAIKRPLENQYFEDFLPKCDVFIDCGSFDGKNAIDFAQFNPNYKKIYCFEPDKTNLKKLKINVSNLKNISVFNYGVSNKHSTFSFCETGDTGGYLTTNGSTKIECYPLNDLIKETEALYIKMDIEGAESDALDGASNLIKNNATLAISVYHKPQDIWSLLEQISKINSNYDFYLRHYTSTIFDTILYAVPKTNCYQN